MFWCLCSRILISLFLPYSSALFHINVSLSVGINRHNDLMFLLSSVICIYLFVYFYLLDSLYWRNTRSLQRSWRRCVIISPWQKTTWLVISNRQTVLSVSQTCSSTSRSIRSEINFLCFLAQHLFSSVKINFTPWPYSSSCFIPVWPPGSTKRCINKCQCLEWGHYKYWKVSGGKPEQADARSNQRPWKQVGRG